MSVPEARHLPIADIDWALAIPALEAEIAAERAKQTKPPTYPPLYLKDCPDYGSCRFGTERQANRRHQCL